MEIKYSKNALKFLSKQPQSVITRIKNAITELTNTPPTGDIKPLQGYNDNRKRLRVGAWRIIFKLTEENNIEILLIIDIGNRGDIYK